MAMSSGGGDSGEPMMDINTTPLIDVMLVLLIMLIVTLPPPTHAVKIDLPQDCAPNCPPKPPIDPVKNVLYVTPPPSDTIMWNNNPIALSQLRGLLDATQTMDPIPELHLQPDPQARYETIDKVLAETKKAKVNKMGFIGNEAYRGF